MPPPHPTTADPMPDDAPRRVVIFGGTFDPPHRAHTELPTVVLDRLDADRLLYVPAGRSPFKLDHEQSAPHHRLAMLRLALQDVNHADIDTGEVDRGDDEPSFTIDTAERLQRRFGDRTELRLLIGTDQLFSFPLWHRAETLARLAPLAVLVRPPHGRDEARRWLRDEAPAYLHGVELIDAPTLDVSSSTIRDAVRRGEDVTAWVAPAVAAYIDQHTLYRE